MATIIQPYNGWREKLAVDVLGGLIGSILQRSNQANQNRKLNALRGVVQEELNAMNAPQQQAAPQITPSDYNSNGWQSAFHSMENPIAQFNAGTADITPSVTPSMNSYPTQADIQGIIAKNLATKRFGMLDPKLVQETLTPYLQAAEAARIENIRNQYGDDLMNAADGTARRNLLWGGYGRGLNPLDAVMVGHEQMLADRPAPVSFNTGGHIVYGNRDPITGQITLDDNKIPMELTPGQVQQGSQWQQTFDANDRQRGIDNAYRQTQADRVYGLQEREFEHRTQPQYTIQAINGKLYYVSNNPNVPPQPFMIDGKHADAQQIPSTNMQISPAQKVIIEGHQAEIKSINAQIEGLIKKKAEAYGDQKDSIQQEIDKLKEEKNKYQQEIYSILYPPQNTQQTTGENTPGLMPRAQLGDSTDIGRNMLNGARNIKISSGFNSPRPNGRKHQGVDYAAAKGEQILVPDVGTSLTVKSVGNDPHHSYGNHVVLEGNLNGHKIEITIAHMDNGSVKLQQGQTVTPGDLIGLVGNTGNTSDKSKGDKITNWYEGKKSGYHLHIETKLDGQHVDPTKFIDNIAPLISSERPNPKRPLYRKPNPLYRKPNGEELSAKEYEALLNNRGGDEAQLEQDLISEGYTRIGNNSKSTQTTIPDITSPDVAPVNSNSQVAGNGRPDEQSTSNNAPSIMAGLVSGDHSPAPAYTDEINGTTTAQNQEQMNKLNGINNSNNTFSWGNAPAGFFARYLPSNSFASRYRDFMNKGIIDIPNYTGPLYGTPEFDEEFRRNMDDWIRHEREVTRPGAPRGQMVLL